MKWTNLNSNNLIGIKCINSIKDKYTLELSPNSKNLELNNYDVLDNCNLRIMSKIVNGEPTLEVIKELLLSLQKEYDSSNEVNTCIINNQKCWFDKNTRIGLLQRANIEKLTKSITTIWINNNSITTSIENIIDFITNLELYSIDCFDNTQRHYQEIKELDSVKEALQYDITSGYPDIINVQI